MELPCSAAFKFNDQPLCVLEAKKESIHPLTAKDQARGYASRNSIPFIILSNGNTHYFWDLKNSLQPEQIVEFPTQESLIERLNYNPIKQNLSNEKVDEFYLANSKFPSIAQRTEEDQNILLKEYKLKKLRYYQVEAIQSIQNAIADNRTRFLLEMATGTGKTTTTAAICKLFLSSGNVNRILFLVDRIELEEQAVKELNNMIGNDYSVDTFKKTKDGSWRSNRIIVSTIKTLMSNDKYKNDFTPTDFQLVISDEAHRSLGGDSRKVFEYFVGYKLGLRTSPKSF